MKSKSDSTQTVLVTGGGGYIGTHVVEQLLKKGYKVRIYDQFVFGKDVISDLRRNKNLSTITGDIDDTKKLVSAFDGVDSIIHLAGIVGDPASLVDEDFTIHTNITLTRKLKNISKKNNIERFIFASSCSVYGFLDDLIDEESKLNPVSLYAMTKIDSEKEILNDSNPNFHPTILRFATVFGHSRRPRFDLVANLFTAQAYHSGLINVQNKDSCRPFIHASDVARAVVLSLESPVNKVSRQIFNVGGDSLNFTIGNLAKIVAKTVGKNKTGNLVEVSYMDNKNDNRNYKVSFKKIKRALGFKPKISIEKGILEMRENFKKGVYKDNYKDPLYINVEMTKLMQINRNKK